MSLTVNNSASIPKKLLLPFHGSLDWQHMLNFYRMRAVTGMELVNDDEYQRSFTIENGKGWFRVARHDEQHLLLTFYLDDPDLEPAMLAQIRRMFDLYADMSAIEQHLCTNGLADLVCSGVRIPGVWNTWEAGIRAILGQQISVKAAITQLNTFVAALGGYESSLGGLQDIRYFPTPAQVAASDLSFLRMPERRKETIQRFAQHMINHFDEHPSHWLVLKGIGPWTVNYAKIRGLSEPDCFLATDLVVKKAIATRADFSADALSPWGSYATFHCWNSMS